MKLLTAIAALCVSFVRSEEPDSYGSQMDLAFGGDIAEETASTAYALWSEPVSGSIISEENFALITKLDYSVADVEFQIISPDGQESGWMSGESESGTSLPSLWSVVISSYIGPGTYSWRFKTIDPDGNELISDSTSFEVDLEATSFGLVKQMIVNNIEQNGRLAEDYIKLAYQDCLVKCDGCVDLEHGDPHKLSDVIDTLEPIWHIAINDYGISRADIFTFAGLIGAEMSESNDGTEFPMEWSGRPDCERIIYPCYSAEGNRVMCGPKVAPEYPNLQSSAFSATADYGAMTFDDIKSVQDHGDVGLRKVGCDNYFGPCPVGDDSNYEGAIGK